MKLGRQINKLNNKNQLNFLYQKVSEKCKVNIDKTCLFQSKTLIFMILRSLSNLRNQYRILLGGIINQVLILVSKQIKKQTSHYR